MSNSSINYNVVGITQQYIRLSGVSAKGSTNTLVYQLSTIAEQTGTGITVTNSAANGGYISVATAGIYDVTLGNYNNSGSAQTIFIKKSTTVTNSASGADSDLISYQTIQSGSVGSCSTTVYLTTSDKIFFTSPFTPTNTSPLMNHVMIARVS